MLLHITLRQCTLKEFFMRVFELKISTLRCLGVAYVAYLQEIV